MSNRIGIGIDVFGAGIDANAQTIYNRIIADGGVSNLTRLNFFVKGLKAIYGDLANVPVCYDAHWIGYKLGSGTGATAGQAAAKLYSLTVAGDAVQATAASQPLLLAHNGASSDNYWYGSGVVGNYVSSTITYATSTVEMETTFSLNATTGQPNIISGGNGTNNSFYFFYDLSASAIVFQYYTSGFKSAFALTSFTNLDTFYVLRNATTGAITFKKNGTTLTTLNSQVAGALDYSITQVKIGEGNSKVNRVKMFIAGTPVVDFNPATYNAATSQTAWTSATGEIWTISTGTATTGYKGVLVDRTIVQSDGVDDYLDNPTFLRNSLMTQYLAFSSQAASVSGVPQIIDSSSTNYRNSIFQNAALLIASWLNGASTMGSLSNVLNRRYIVSANYNAGISNSVKLNDVFNSGDINTYSPTPSATGIRLFSKGGAVSSHNATINTYVYCANNDTANNTTMFNFLKTLNNL